jgi:4-amino-4-deoxy-L-arabinose transferase-like glycosyltransferase
VGRGGWTRDGRTAVLAALFLALSPFAIQFSATAFTDPLLTFWLVAAMVASGGWRVASDHPLPATRHPLLTGLFFGLAVATKYQAWLFLPLLVGLGWRQGWRRPEWARFGLGLLPVLALLLAWDVARTGGFSLWAAQMGSYGGVRLSWSWELWPRLLAWLRLWHWLFVSPLATAVLLLTLLLPNFTIHNSQFTIHNFFPLAYFLLHWFLAVPVWDRYLLPLLPILVMLMAGKIVNCQWSMVNGQRRGAFIVLSSLLIVSLLFPAWAGRNGRYPIGGQPTADGGAAQIAALLYDAPYGTVLYDHWYSWRLVLVFFNKMAFSNLILARGDTFLYFYPYWQAAAEALGARARTAVEPPPVHGRAAAGKQPGRFFLPAELAGLAAAAHALRRQRQHHAARAHCRNWGAYLLAKRALILDWQAALLTAVFFSLGGYFTAQVEHINQVQGLAWLPWLLWAVTPAAGTPIGVGR